MQRADVKQWAVENGWEDLYDVVRKEIDDVMYLMGFQADGVRIVCGGLKPPTPLRVIGEAAYDTIHLDEADNTLCGLVADDKLNFVVKGNESTPVHRP